MKVILKEDIFRVGRKHEIKDVANGYARNFLIPRGKAELATVRLEERAQKAFEASEKIRAGKEKAIEEKLNSLNEKEIITTARASEKGGLFAKISKEDIILLLKENGYGEIGEEQINFEEPIKTLGDHKIELLLDGKKKGEFTLKVENK